MRSGGAGSSLMPIPTQSALIGYSAFGIVMVSQPKLWSGIQIGASDEAGGYGKQHVLIARRSTRCALAGLISQTVLLQPFVDGDDRLRGACPWHPDVDRSLHATDPARQCFAYRAGGDAVDRIIKRDAVDKTRAGNDFGNLSFQNNEVGRGGASSKSMNALKALSDRSRVRVSIVWRIAVTRHDRPHSKSVESGPAAFGQRSA